MQNYVRSAAQWQFPVRIKDGRGIPEAIHGPEEALEHLTYRWPAETGSHYDNARRQCLNARQRGVPVEVVREAFVAASLEAGMLVTEPVSFGWIETN